MSLPISAISPTATPAATSAAPQKPPAPAAPAATPAAVVSLSPQAKALASHDGDGDGK